MAAYINLGVPAENLVTSSVMSIPASIAISKMRIPELDEPVTRGHVVVDRGQAEKNPPVRAIIDFSSQVSLISGKGECSTCFQQGCCVWSCCSRSNSVSLWDNLAST